jgi:hypothetical protein
MSIITKAKSTETFLTSLDHVEEEKEIIEKFKNEIGKLPECNNKIEIQ